MIPESDVILITGLPRSGTTLIISLLNQQHDVVALAEPLHLAAMSSDKGNFIKEIASFAEDMRRRALEDNEIVTKAVNGKLTGNFVLDNDRGTGLRKSHAKTMIVRVEKPLSKNFRLCIKHPAAFSALVGPLSARFPFYACIRSPLAVLASWQTVDMPVNRGRAPMAERFSPELAARLDDMEDVLDRQVLLMGWFLEAYATLAPERIIRFEDMSRDPARVLSRICPDAVVPQWTLETQNLSERYPSVDIDRLRRALKPIEDVVRYHYSDGLPY